MDREYAASLRDDEMRDWARHAPGPRHRIDRGGLPVREDLPEPHDIEETDTDEH